MCVCAFPSSRFEREQSVVIASDDYGMRRHDQPSSWRVVYGECAPTCMRRKEIRHTGAGNMTMLVHTCFFEE